MQGRTLPKSAYEGLGLPSQTVKVLTTPTPTPAMSPSPNLMQVEPLPVDNLSLDETSITLYAEVLLNIRTATLFASLRTVKNESTKAFLSTDGYSITVSHDGESATIRLPIKAEGGGDAALNLPAVPQTKQLSLRLQIKEQEGSDLFTSVHAEDRKANVVPWDGASLNATKSARILCKNCKSRILPRGKVLEWRDLPNENWAEMMDFWHCHKPDEHHLHGHEHEDVVSRKGYSAGSRLKAASGIGFVDLLTLLLSEQDCENITVSPPNLLTCTECTHPLGLPDAPASGLRLWKWSISIASNNPPSSAKPTLSSSSSTYTPQKWISARLLFLIENTGVRKFLVHPDTDAPEGGGGEDKSAAGADANANADAETDDVPALLLWVFTPDLLFSSSIPSPHRQDPTRAMKVFYQEKEWRPLRPGDVEEAGVEEVGFPGTLFGELRTALERSGRLLPEGARRFQGWEVGLLERFEVGE